MNAEACPMADCEGRLSVLEASLTEAKKVADKAAEDVVRIERDVDRIGSEMRRIRAVMVGSDAEEKGGLRAEVQAIAGKVDRFVDRSERNQTWMLRMLGAVLLIVSPDQVIKIVKAIHEWAMGGGLP